MPLARFQVRSEYGLGQPDLYREANREDPKAVLDGVAVAGLVGILRQLGDLAEFAAEVFHGLQEQVMATASRSHKLKVRVQNIEAALPPLEKAVLAQTSHIHFAYTAGSEWHPRLKNEQNHFIHSDLPRFIMDSYEECRDPPRLHLLDKFDSDGPGSCLKRYSDPTFFRKVSSNSKEHDEEKVLRDKKGRKIKKKRSSQRSKDLLRSASMPNHSGRMHFTQPIINGQTSPSHAASTIDMTLKPDLGDHSNSFDSKAGSGYIECVFHRNSSAQPEEHESEKLPSRFAQHDHISDSAFHSGQSDKLPSRFVQHDHISDSASHGGQSEKLPSRFVQHDHASDSTFHSGQSDKLPSRFVQHDHISDSAFHGGQSEKLSSRFVQHDHSSDSAFHSGQSEKFPAKFVHHDYLSDSAFPGGQADAVGDSFVQNSSPEQIDPRSSCVTWDEKEEILEPSSQNCHGDEASAVLTTASDLDARERMIPSHRSPDQMDIVFDGENTRKLSSSRNQLDDIESEPDYYVDALNTIESESETDLDCQTKQGEQVSSHFNNEQMEDRMDHAAADISCQHPSKDEFHIVSDIFSNKGMSCDLPNSVTSHSFNHQHASQISKDSDSGYSPGIAGPTSAEALDGLKGDSVQTDPSSNLDKSGPSKSFTHDETTHISGEFSNLDSAHKIEGSSKPDAFDGSKVDSVATEQPIKVSPRTDALDDSKVDSVVTEVTEQHIEGASPADALNSPEVEPLLTEPPTSLSGVSNLQPLENGTVSSFGKFQEIQVEFSGPHSMSFWTNGGLLGLQPSKPPDFAVSKTATQDLVTGSKVGALGFQNHSFMQRYSGEEGKAKGLGEDPGSTEGLSSSKCPPAWQENQKAKVERGCDSQHGNRFNHVNGGEFSATSAMRQGNEPLVDANLKATSFEASQESNENSSQIFGLGHRLLINGFRRKLSLGADCKTELFSSQETSTLEQRSGNHGFTYQAAPEKALNEQFGHKIGIDSLPPSPPLEHMKISFRPLDSFEDSRLRLKIPDGNHCNGSIRDMFPSFQLVPEPGIQRHDVNSDSDDDTFCRSSPYMSDDCPSHRSELDSDQWDSGESSESKDNELYDSFLGVQPVESVPSSFCPGEMGNNGIHIESGIKDLCIRNSADPSLSTSTLDLPSFDAVNGLLQGEMKDKSNPLTQIESQYSGESNPFPPPLPPAEWRFAKAHSDVATGKEDDIPKEHGQALDPKLLVSATCEQPKPIPANELLNNVGTIALKLNRKSSQQVKEHSNGEGMDEKEDFLHQIRAKSFSLRRTATSKPTLTTGPTANHRVNEILEKAIAIRKAVASDDGEDEDTWSDT